MALNPTGGGDTNSWNYSRPEDPGYSLTLRGTVKAIQEVQAMKFDNSGRPSTPDFWENNGQPKMNIRLVLCGKGGGYRTITFQPASKAVKEGKPGPRLHLELFALTGNTNMLNLLEKTIELSTVAPPPGFGYGKGNARPWTAKLIEGEGPYQLSEPLPPQYMVPQLLANQAVSGGQFMPPAQGSATMAPVPTEVISAAPEQMPGMPQPQPAQQAEAPIPAPPAATPPVEDDIPF